MSEKTTCATCKHIGVAYWDDGFTLTHHCLKGDVRRAETMRPTGDFSEDFMHNFRAFFDASANQTACHHYEERAAASVDVIALLRKMKDGQHEFRFFTEDNRMCEQLSGKFVQYRQYAATSHPGGRVYALTGVGKAELARADAPPQAQGQQAHGEAHE